MAAVTNPYKGHTHTHTHKVGARLRKPHGRRGESERCKGKKFFLTVNNINSTLMFKSSYLPMNLKLMLC